ncbi:MAG TPA: aspartate--ammonia ligase [Acidobacteriota bacterium]|nr:aspartate--ammonia ligase [Acidobacteriota bacterium]
MTSPKVLDLAGPGIGNYELLEKVLPDHYTSILDVRETQRAILALKNFIEDQLCKELNLMMVTVPLIVTAESGTNDLLDRDGSRTPIEFPCGLGLKEPLRAQVVQAATKWKRLALKQFNCKIGEGICTDMRAIRKDYWLDHDHSAYVDQWDWELAIANSQRNLSFLTQIVNKIWKVLKRAEEFVQEMYPKLKTDQYRNLPNELTFLHAEEILDLYPDLPRKARETAILQKYPAVFIYGIGYPLLDGYPHEMRAADYDDWTTPVISDSGRLTRGLNGDILVWNPVTKRRHELSSMGIRVDKEALVQQMSMAGLTHLLQSPYHQAIINDRVPFSIGGGIGQSRTQMLLLRKAHLGEVTVSVWPPILNEMCGRKNIHVLQ